MLIQYISFITDEWANFKVYLISGCVKVHIVIKKNPGNMNMSILCCFMQCSATPLYGREVLQYMGGSITIYGRKHYHIYRREVLPYMGEVLPYMGMKYYHIWEGNITTTPLYHYLGGQYYHTPITQDNYHIITDWWKAFKMQLQWKLFSLDMGHRALLYTLWHSRNDIIFTDLSRYKPLIP